MSLGFQYDAFISYRQADPDRTWVQEVLVPTLQAKNLKVCVDYLSFRLGEPLVIAMARAVEESRYTIAVLSPDYLESTFTEVENIMAEHLGLENAQLRLVGVMRARCRPRLGIRSRLWLDMSDDSLFANNIERLASHLRVEPGVKP